METIAIALPCVGLLGAPGQWGWPVGWSVVRGVLAGRLPTADDLPRLVHTRRALQEAMRLYPPVHTFGRGVLREYERLDLFDPSHTAPHATLYLRPVPLRELAASLDAGEQGQVFRRRLAGTLALGSKPEGVLLDIAG